MKRKLLSVIVGCLFAVGAFSQTVNVTFQVHNPDSTPVYVFGSWSGWTNWPGDAMTNIGNGYFQVTLAIPASAGYEFKFVNGAGPTLEPLDPSWPCTNGNAQYTNRVLNLGANDSTVCFDWNSCASCTAPVPNLGVTFQVHNPPSTPVYLIGSWNWSSFPGVPLTAIGNGYYATTLYLPAFTNYEFLYVSGAGNQIESLDSTMACTNHNPQYTNRVLALGGSDTTMCNDWESCTTCQVVTQQRQATFRVENPATTPVYLFGSWNNWSNWPGVQMNSVGGNLYELTIPLNTNSPYEYLFVNGSIPAKEILDPTWSCTNGNFQYTNRVLTMGLSDTTVCSVWETCSTCSGSGIEELNGKTVRLLVSNNGLLFESSSNDRIESVEVYDASGRSISTLTNDFAFNRWIPISVKEGQLYFVRMTSGGQSVSFKTLPIKY